jgi:hypothetical protein
MYCSILLCIIAEQSTVIEWCLLTLAIFCIMYERELEQFEHARVRVQLHVDLFAGLRFLLFIRVVP